MNDIVAIIIQWEGPFSTEEVIEKLRDGGQAPDYGGEDYGLYQIYGSHILYGREKEALLYIGQTTQQTFSQRFSQHKGEWLNKEKNVSIYIGRLVEELYKSKTVWQLWEDLVKIAESIMIYKYAPSYNSSKIGMYPDIKHYKEVKLIHNGSRKDLCDIDMAPGDLK